MKIHKVILGIGIIEILIGGLTLLAIAVSMLNHTNTKTFNVLVFVFLTSLMSLFLGLGILRHNKTAYQVLIYFSSVIALSKVLIFTNIIYLNGALETSIPQFSKDRISILYHVFVVFFLSRKHIKELFWRSERM